MDTEAIVNQLNRILQIELEGVSRYLHHSFMVFGWNREPLVTYFRAQAQESILHATLVGEKIVSLGGHPHVDIKARWEPEGHSVREMLESNLAAEREAVRGYLDLLALVPPDEIALEEMARSMVREEQEHVDELQKYLRAPDRED
jgi:bacterioferritin